jgi:hypothetical protein
MNPELVRNLWIELRPQRVLFSFGAMAAILFFASLSGTGTLETLSRILCYAIMVLWGTRAAAGAVPDEVSARTWDMQRLSAMGPWTLVWGKLIGATAMPWLLAMFACGVCLFAGLRNGETPNTLGLEAMNFLLVGVTATSVSFLSSLIAVRRRFAHSRLYGFVHQAAGALAGGAVAWFWLQLTGQTGTVGLLVSYIFPNFAIQWWGMSFAGPVFYLSSIAAAMAWTLVAAWRLMRLELQMQNGPFVWIAFLIFVGLYAAGFDGIREGLPENVPVWAMRSLAAAAALIIVTYAMAILEPKDAVRFRKLGAAALSGQASETLRLFPAWGVAYLAAAVLAVSAISVLPGGIEFAGLDAAVERLTAFAPAVFGFVARDIGIFLLLGMSRYGQKSDLGAFVFVLLAYSIVPQILAEQLKIVPLAFLIPAPTDPWWLGPAFAWGQAALVWGLLVTRRDLRAPTPS